MSTHDDDVAFSVGPSGYVDRDPRRATRQDHPTLVQGRVHSAASRPMLGRHRHLHPGPDQPVRTQDRVDEFEERVYAGAVGVVALEPKAGQQPQRLASGHPDGDAHGQRPFSRTSSLDISKREERPRLPRRINGSEPQPLCVSV